MFTALVRSEQAVRVFRFVMNRAGFECIYVHMVNLLRKLKIERGNIYVHVAIGTYKH